MEFPGYVTPPPNERAGGVTRCPVTVDNCTHFLMFHCSANRCRPAAFGCSLERVLFTIWKRLRVT
jgi:hypothetical protein